MHAYAFLRLHKQHTQQGTCRVPTIMIPELQPKTAPVGLDGGSQSIDIDQGVANLNTITRGPLMEPNRGRDTSLSDSRVMRWLCDRGLLRPFASVGPHNSTDLSCLAHSSVVILSHNRGPAFRPVEFRREND